eukprot:TRINITY_DN14162_c2_g1_i1.p1 TRINITY_DN14162_c2_g1~~TRINITY_DN14162_c2_g1_i1.p1  ORF type:complete len:343 (+),score=69.57 TRINITY_DN14162_c2_g1_i1:80-1030(+)
MGQMCGPTQQEPTAQIQQEPAPLDGLSLVQLAQLADRFRPTGIDSVRLQLVTLLAQCPEAQTAAARARELPQPPATPSPAAATPQGTVDEGSPTQPAAVVSPGLQSSVGGSQCPPAAPAPPPQTPPESPRDCWGAVGMRQRRRSFQGSDRDTTRSPTPLQPPFLHRGGGRMAQSGAVCRGAQRSPDGPRRRHSFGDRPRPAMPRPVQCEKAMEEWRQRDAEDMVALGLDPALARSIGPNTSFSRSSTGDETPLQPPADLAVASRPMERRMSAGSMQARQHTDPDSHRALAPPPPQLARRRSGSGPGSSTGQGPVHF